MALVPITDEERERLERIRDQYRQLVTRQEASLAASRASLASIEATLASETPMVKSPIGGLLDKRI